MKTVKDPLTESWVMAESDQPYSQSSAARRGLAPCDPRRVLIADDEKNIRYVFAKVLESELPATVVLDLAEDGAEAVEMFSQGHHALILMDLAMPRLDGLQAFEQIQDLCSKNQWVPPSVVFCTGFDPPLGVRNVVSADPTHCLLRKPVSNRTLMTAVQKRLATDDRQAG